MSKCGQPEDEDVSTLNYAAHAQARILGFVSAKHYPERGTRSYESLLTSVAKYADDYGVLDIDVADAVNIYIAVGIAHDSR